MGGAFRGPAGQAASRPRPVRGPGSHNRPERARLGLSPFGPLTVPDWDRPPWLAQGGSA